MPSKKSRSWETANQSHSLKPSSVVNPSPSRTRSRHSRTRTRTKSRSSPLQPPFLVLSTMRHLVLVNPEGPTTPAVRT